MSFTAADLRADKAAAKIWSEWLTFYSSHFRAKGIAISMADQQAFLEIAQPILRELVRSKQS